MIVSTSSSCSPSVYHSTYHNHLNVPYSQLCGKPSPCAQWQQQWQRCEVDQEGSNAVLGMRNGGGRGHRVAVPVDV